MKTIICKNVGSTSSISINSEYQVLNETDTRYTLINDKGVQKNYSKKLFSEKVTRRNNKVTPQAMEVVPPPPPIPVIVVNTINELDIQIDTRLDDNIIVSEVIINANDNLLTLNRSFSTLVRQTDISCGIHQISGLNSIFDNLNIIRNSIQNALSQTLVLAEDIDINEILNTLLESLLQEILDTVPRTSILLFSTNINNNPTIRDSYIGKLDDISSYNVVTRNPNNDNNIKLWTVLMDQ